MSSIPRAAFELELERLASLRSFGILGTPPEQSFDAITRTAARILDVPVATISFIDADRQWCKSAVGGPGAGSGAVRDAAFSAHTILNPDEPLIVEDATLDPRFASSPLVTVGGVRAYAAMPIVDSDNRALGSLCVMDVRPRSFTGRDIAVLRDLAISIGCALDLRRTSRRLEDSVALQRATSALTPHLHWVADSNARLLQAGPHFGSLGYLDPMPLLGDGWQRLVHPDDWTAMRGLWSEAVDAVQTYRAEHRLRTAQGEWRWFQTVAIPQWEQAGRVLRWYGACEDINERREAEAARQSERRASDAQIAYLHEHDPLTDLPVADVLYRLVSESCAHGEDCALLSIDIDNFSAVNDTLTWQDSDLALIVIAARLAACVGERGMLARSHGDEFYIVQRTADAHDVALLAERIRESLRDPVVIGVHEFSLSVSIGAALSPSGGRTVDQLFHNAELALHRAKAEGRDTFRLFTAESDERARLRQALTLDLGLALHRNELGLAFQPFVTTAEGKVEGFEALLRWIHPVYGSIPPSEFVPIAEHAGLIGSIGSWALERACREAALWPAPLRVAVNLSPLQLRDPGLPHLVASTLTASGLSPSRLEIEITESRLIVDDEIAHATMRRFRELGVRLVMDDFGAGFSSLDVLQRFCFDKVKIDRSFAARLPASSEARALLRALLDMASALQITAVLEGVETAAQLALARSEGCAVVQGYLHSAPVAAAEVPGVIATIEGSAPRLRGRFGLRRLAQGPSGAVVGGSSGSM